MSIVIEAIQQPFMQRALIAGLLIGPLLGLFGVIVSMRRMAFFGEGVAHASLAGIAIGITASITPLPVAIAWGALVGALVFLIEKRSNISSDAAIGILFTTSMAFGLAIISATPGYQPELMTYLFGNILSVRNTDILYLAIASPLILIWLAKTMKHLTIISINEELAHVRNIRVERMMLFLYMVLAVAIVLSTKIMGIILVSALLITPPAIAKLLARSYKGFIVYSIVASLCMILIGLVLSYLANIPSGPMIVLTGSFLFLLGQIAYLGRAN